MQDEIVVDYLEVDNLKIQRRIGEFWTSKQRQGSSLHEVSYRACFKPQLPNYFIKKYTNPGEIVYDPFGGRGTTAIEAVLLGRNIIQNDVNPISTIFAKGRIFAPSLEEIETRINEIPMHDDFVSDIDLSMFYQKNTLDEILSYKAYFLEKEKSKTIDSIDDWIRMVATNRLTGHSKGFFSVYTLPPNQAVSCARQLVINEKRNQTPEYKDTKKLILKKSKQLLSKIDSEQLSNLRGSSANSVFLNNPASNTPEIQSESVALVVTSPPFLDVVQYDDDNWLRCWFNNVDISEIGKKITMAKDVNTWSKQMELVLIELHRILKNGGHIAFEVGEVRNGKIKLDELIVPIGLRIGFKCKYLLINSQIFTKTSNIWGVKNNEIGTNTNRVVLFEKR
jgi:DNA modification methylase